MSAARSFGPMKMPSTPSMSGDRLEIRERRARLDLKEQAHLVVHALEVILDAAIAIGASGSGDTAHALRRIAKPGDGAPRLLRVLHVRNQQRARADVEVALDEHDVVPCRPHDRFGRAFAERDPVELRLHHRQLVGRMLGVEQHPVESGVGEHFGRDVAAEARPDADLRLAGFDRLLELIDWQFHVYAS